MTFHESNSSAFGLLDKVKFPAQITKVLLNSAPLANDGTLIASWLLCIYHLSSYWGSGFSDFSELKLWKFSNIRAHFIVIYYSLEDPKEDLGERQMSIRNIQSFSCDTQILTLLILLGGGVEQFPLEVFPP